MTDADTMADNAVRCDSNRTSDSNGMGDSNGTSNGMADNTVADSDSNIRVGSSAVVGDLGHLCHT